MVSAASIYCWPPAGKLSVHVAMLLPQQIAWGYPSSASGAEAAPFTVPVAGIADRYSRPFFYEPGLDVPDPLPPHTRRRGQKWMVGSNPQG